MSCRCPSTAATGALSGDGEDDVPCLLLRLDVRRRLDDVVQWVAPVDHGAVVPLLDELLEEEDVLLGVCLAS